MSIDSAPSAPTQSPRSSVQGALHMIPGMWPALPLLSPVGQWAPGPAGWRLLSGAGSQGSLHLGLLCFSSHISGPFPPFPKCPAPCSSHTHSGSPAQEILRPSPAVRPHPHTCSSLVPQRGTHRHTHCPLAPSMDPCPHLCICSSAWGGLHPTASDSETTQRRPDVQSQTPPMSLVSGTSSQADPRGATLRQPCDVPRSLSRCPKLEPSVSSFCALGP